MIFTLIGTGHLAAWQWPVFIICILIITTGSAALGVAWRLGLFRRIR